MEPRVALRRLEAAFRDWYWATGKDMPDIGILVISLDRAGCDLQYLGAAPNTVVDWPALFAGIIKEIESGRYSVDSTAEVPFNR